MDFVKKNPCSIPLLFLLAYGIPIIIWVSNYSPSVTFWIRGVALIAYLNIFTQVMLGSFRKFFNEHYNVKTIYKLHNWLGLITLILALVHGLYKAWNLGLIPTLLINSSLAFNLGTIGLYLLIITVSISDLKFFFRVKVNARLWRYTHYLNYLVFPLIYAHAMMIGTEFREPLMQYLSMTLLGLSIIAVIKKVKL